MPDLRVRFFVYDTRPRLTQFVKHIIVISEHTCGGVSVKTITRFIILYTFTYELVSR